MRLNRRHFVLSPMMSAAVPRTGFAASTATPEASDPSANRLRGMLAAVPPETLMAGAPVSWVDAATQFSAYPDLGENSLLVLPANDATRFFARVEDSLTLLGLDMAEIDQAIAWGQPPDIVTMFRMQSPVAPLATVWEQAGYSRHDDSGAPWWTVGEHGEMDLASDISRAFLAGANNIAMVDDVTIVFAPTRDLLETMLAVDRTVPLPESIDEVTLHVPQESVSAWLLDGTSVQISTYDAISLAESDDAVGPMPAITRLVIGQTAGVSAVPEYQLDHATGWMLLQTDGAAKLAAEVMTWRFASMSSIVNGQPFSEMLAGLEIAAVDEDTVLATVSGAPAHGNTFARMIMARDILLSYWSTD